MQNLDSYGQRNHSGIDESGKGDYFGALAVSGVYLPLAKVEEVRGWGVRDSKGIADNVALRLAAVIEDNLVHHSIVYDPPQYNERYGRFNNLNHLLADAHAQIIAALMAKTACANVISDKFASSAALIPSYLPSGCSPRLLQITKAERDLAVACASVVARANFLRSLQRLAATHGMKFPKGASNQVKAQARQLRQRYGARMLAQVAKVHFKMD
ncbi:MAG: ribonuclease HIII [Pseudomonadota bacterium]|nr:ribonuclease HIII [Pseudomonadota bacterium]